MKDFSFYLDLVNNLTFNAIDFETANEKRSSACSIAIVKVVKGNIVDRKHYYIKPKEVRFSQINSMINRISIDDLANAQEFGDIWNQIEDCFHDQVIIAHNAEFDMSVLRELVNLYQLPNSNYFYMCSLKLVQEAFPKIKNCQLAYVANYFSIPHRHHDALSDAEVCAKISLRALSEGVFDFNSERQELTHYIKKKAPKLKIINTPWADKDVHSDLLKTLEDVQNIDSSFAGKRIVFTGDLISMKRNEAAIIVRQLGADINTSLSKKTDIVIVGKNPGKLKIEMINKLIAGGCDIQLMNEEEFLRHINMEKEVTNER